jgi:heat shock protein HspQ
MGTVTSIVRAKFAIGQLVHHRLFNYRGVIVDVHPRFQGTPEWYDAVARSRPPKDKPWYQVLVHQAEHSTYVAERNLESDDLGDPIDHPMVEHFFAGFEAGRYLSGDRAN